MRFVKIEPDTKLKQTIFIREEKIFGFRVIEGQNTVIFVDANHQISHFEIKDPIEVVLKSVVEI